MSVPERSHPNPDLALLVKVYCLNTQGAEPTDHGAGHVTMDYIEPSKELGIYVLGEADNATLLSHRISIECNYKKDRDTVITWTDPVHLKEFALSFLEVAACIYVWEHIYRVQQCQSLKFLSTGYTFNDVSSKFGVLADVKLSTLPQIHEIVTGSDSTDHTCLTELMLKDNIDFFGKLMNVFDICEESKNVDGLPMMFNIVKTIILFNSPQILEKILGDGLIMKIIGCLEYDPDVLQHQHHRNYLQEHVVFKEAIPIKDPLVVSKIHQTYRIRYLKDVILTKGLNDTTAQNLNSVISLNEATIVTLLMDDSTFFQELLTRLRSPSTSVESRNNLVHFLHEFCGLSKKSLNMVHQGRLFRKLMNGGILDIIAEVLQSQDKKLVIIGTEILSIFLTYKPNLLRSDVVKLETPLFGLLVKGMMEDYGDEMDCQFIEIFKILLARKTVRLANIMNNLCEKPEIAEFITASCSENRGDISEVSTKRVLLDICELMCICFRQISFRRIFLNTNMMEKVLLLTRRKEHSIVAAAIRVFRTVLSFRVKYFQSYVVKNNLMKPIIDVLVANGNRDNLVVSAILELLQHIHKKKSDMLNKYIVDTFSDELTPFQHLTTILNPKPPRNVGGLVDYADTDDEDDVGKNQDVKDKDQDDKDEEDKDRYVKEDDEEEKDESGVAEMDMD